MLDHRQLHRELTGLADPAKAEHAHRFFKSGPGEYGEGDRFLGIRVPPLRQLARQYRDLPQAEVLKTLQSPWHEERLAALLIWVLQFPRASLPDQQQIYRSYLAHTHYINNWDLVDVSAPPIVGAWLFARKRMPLLRLAKSSCLWDRRIAMLATFYFIRQHQFEDTLALAEILVHDPEDLMHKAVGWMLREVGNRDREVEEQFLMRHLATMPRTMLRYAIERFPEEKRQRYLKGDVRG